MKGSSNLVAIVGRPNVGKSTLFNRLTETSKAIVDEKSGVTRDRHYGHADWSGHSFSVVDTGGYMSGSGDSFETPINQQVELAIEEADLILFMVDTETGITDLDEQLAGHLRKRGKDNVIVVANKTDHHEDEMGSAVFHGLGWEAVMAISARNGRGTGDLLDVVIERLSSKHVPEGPDVPRIAVVGRPNVGKSSLVNTLLGVDRNVVTDIPGTTRDSIDSRFKGYGFDLLMVDTAGIRKKGKIREDLEYYSNLRSIRAIERSDTAILMLDATQGMEKQELKILQIISQYRKGVVIAVNKWDLIGKDNKTADDYRAHILERAAPFSDIPIVFISVPERKRVFKVLEAAVRVVENRQKKIGTGELNRVMLNAIEHYPPPLHKGSRVRIKYVQQMGTAAPTFAFYCNKPRGIRPPYQRYLENKLRENFGFEGVPLKTVFKEK